MIKAWHVVNGKDEFKEVTFWRYSIPNEEKQGQGWGTFIIDSTGMFCAITDYGNYIYKWTHHGKDDVRKFILEIGAYYLLSKVGTKEYDNERTVAHIKETIDGMYKDGDIKKVMAANEREFLLILKEDGDFHDWQRCTDLGDAHEYACYGYTAHNTMFAEKLFPRLQAAIREELEREAGQ